MNIFKGEKQEFKSKDELLREVIRNRFDECTTDFSGDIESIDLIDLAIHYGYTDLARQMRSDFDINKKESLSDNRSDDENYFYGNLDHYLS